MVTKKDLEDYRKLESDKTVNVFNINIIFEVMSNEDIDHIDDDKLLDVANIVRDCYLKDDDNFTLSQIVNAVLLNYKDIKEQDLGPRQILAKFI